MKTERFFFLGLRFAMALIFLWAFADKTFGLGFATPSASSWLNGGSPTYGYLTNAVTGPFASFFTSLAGVAWVDWVFMAGLLGVGLTLLLNRYVLWGSTAGSLILALMYLATFQPVNNPLIDDHLVYILVLGLIASRRRDW